MRGLEHGASAEIGQEEIGPWRGYLTARPRWWRKKVTMLCPHEHPNSAEAAACADLVIGRAKQRYEEERS